MLKEWESLITTELYNYIQNAWPDQTIYIWIDVGKNILDVGVTIWNSDFEFYLWTIKNTASGFKEIESMILNLIVLWIDENNIFFWTENTWIYWHDVMNYFDDRIPNTYILNSSLTCHARAYYAKSESKSDNIDAIIIAVTLRDLDSKNQLECVRTPFGNNSWLWFVRRSFSNERSSLRILFRRLSALRAQKSKLMTSINMSKERLFPEINGIFSIKHRASSEAILLNNFTRSEILNMTKDEFLQKYRSLATKWQANSRVLVKVWEFYDRVVTRWEKESRSTLDKVMWKDSDSYILEEINYKLKHYELTINEMEAVRQKISDLLKILKKNWYFIPKFAGINDIEIWLILGELWFDVYTMNSREFIWFVWRYPENYTSWWWHMVKVPKLSKKKWIIKKFVYVWMYGFQLHNHSFRLYKKLLTLLYGINDENISVVTMKNRRKIETKCWEKLLEIIHDWYKNQRTFCEQRFFQGTINPLIHRIKENGLSEESINLIINDVYKNKAIPSEIRV